MRDWHFDDFGADARRTATGAGRTKASPTEHDGARRRRGGRNPGVKEQPGEILLSGNAKAAGLCYRDGDQVRFTLSGVETHGFSYVPAA